MSILARSKPYPHIRTKGAYICKRCGIQRIGNGTRKPTYCRDCKPYTEGAKQ